MTRARFGILGTLEVYGVDRPTDITATQQRRLLCILLLSPGRHVSLDTLAERMWPSDGLDQTRLPNRPNSTLRVYASRLRRLFPEQLAQYGDSRGYTLDVARDEVDAFRFETMMADSFEESSTDPVRAATTLREALALWRGPALVEFCDEPWALGTAVRLNELRLAAHERLNDARLGLGDHGPLCGELEHLVEENPLRERFWAQFMIALYRSGRQADALRAYQRLRNRLVDDLGIEPSRELIELEAAVLRQDPSLEGRSASEVMRGGQVAAARIGSAQAAREPELDVAPDAPETHHNLPAQFTSFIGREREAKEVQALTQGFRLVTLTGLGGIGKTRLALEVASQLVEDFADGVWLVELATATPGDVEVAIAKALGITPRAGMSVLDALLEALRSARLLLLIDNCEHLVSSCASNCYAILRSCQSVSVLATSREPLGIDGEVIYRVLPLGLPAPSEDDLAIIAAEDAVRLFVERARVQQPTFVLDESNAQVVASLCRHLDGIALALELAAARLRALSVTEVRDRLDERFSLLVGGGRTKLARQQTLRALIDWSYDLLSSREQLLLRHLGVFSGSFDLAAIEALVQRSSVSAGAGAVAGATAAGSVLEDLALLVDKSLVGAETSGPTSRFRLLETIRQYSLEKLAKEEGSQALAGLREAHAAIYLELAERAAPLLATPEQFTWLDRLELDSDNLRAALGHLVSTRETARDAMRLIVALNRFLNWRGKEAELLSAIEALEEMGELQSRSDPLAMRVVVIRSRLIGQSDTTQAIEQLEGELEAARELGEHGLAAEVLTRLAWLSWSAGERDDSRRLRCEAVEAARMSGEYLPLLRALNSGGASLAERREALEMSRAQGDALGTYAVLCNLGSIALDEGDATGAKSYYEEALPIMEQARPNEADAYLLVNLGTALVIGADHTAAEPLYARALEGARLHLHGLLTNYALLGLALCASSRGDHRLAATLHGASEQQFLLGGFAPEVAERRLADDDEALLRAALGDVQFEMAKERGRCLVRDEAIDLALGRSTRAAHDS
jgi:predicted ATPase/DNA-binding SARP family transcriptional activator